MRARTARWAVIVGFAAAGAIVIACEAGDDTLPAKPYDAGTSGGDGTVVGDGVAPAEDTAAPPGAPLCAKYGADLPGKVTASVFANVGADCRISAYFTAPSKGIDHLKQCFEKQMGTFFQCPGAVYDKDNAGEACRTMLDAHKQIQPRIRRADFDAFISDTIAALQANGVADDDIRAVIPTFIGTQTAVVEQQNGIGNANCTCPNLTLPDGGYCGIDAGVDASDADAAKDGVSDVVTAQDADDSG